MEFAPRVNRNGDIAWADVFGDSQKDSISKNDVYFNGRLIAQDSPVQDIALSDDYLAWVSPDGVGTQVTFYNILTHELTTQSLDFATDTIRNLRGDFVVSGLDVGTGDAISYQAKQFLTLFEDSNFVGSVNQCSKIESAEYRTNGKISRSYPEVHDGERFALFG